jgi:superfamily II DNA or RNA helicase
MHCKLIIRDEVNAKFDGLPADVRRTLVKRFSFELPYARHLPSVRLGRWDGRVNFFQLSGSTYINLLPEILPYLDELGYDIELLDTRDYQTHFTFQPVTESSYSHKTWPAKHQMAGQPIQIRPHQVKIINDFLFNTQSLQEAATSSGKTLVSAVLSHQCERFGRTLVIVPNKSLVLQTLADYENLGLDVGVYYGERKEHGHKHTISTWQSLNSLLKSSREGKADIDFSEFVDGVVCVLVDEAHSISADVLKSMLSGPLARVPIRWGLTGTIPREDFNFYSLRVCIGEVIGKVTASELQEQGILANCQINILQLIDYVEYKDYQSELKYLVDNTNRITYLAGKIAEIAETGNTLVLVDRIGTGNALQAMLDGSVFVSGSTKTSQRQEHYEQIALSDNLITIATYGVAAVGINVPRLHNIMLLEPGKSFVRVIQSIGRGLRKAHDKDSVVIWDITSTCKFSKRHLTKRKQYYRDAQYPFSVDRIDWQNI